MEIYRLNIDKVTNIEELFNVGWLYKDIKENEIVLETSSLDFNEARIRATFIILCEGILNSKPNMSYDQKQKIDYDQFDIPDLETLAKELTKLTGIRFSSGLVF